MKEINLKISKVLTLVVGRIKVLRLDAQRLFRVEFVGDIAYENVGYVGLTLETTVYPHGQKTECKFHLYGL